MDSVSHVLDENAQTLSRTQYEPYGETLVQRGSLDFAPKYNSQELDRETNFYFYNARYYDPEIGRFTSADSVIDGDDDTQGWNRFSYVQGNPIAFKDPTGHLINSPGTKAYIPPSSKPDTTPKSNPNANKPSVSPPSKSIPKKIGSVPKGPPKVPRATPRISPRGGGGLGGTLVTFGLFALAEQYFGPQNYDGNPRVHTGLPIPTLPGETPNPKDNNDSDELYKKILSAEHKKKRPSTEEKHEKGNTRR
ncbi:RHS repeat-associated core domain protein [Leptospira wolffii serovar Khorat str. Khorat-H2]|nr:RHS repeat-associated core domain protein [Leptospira wolffii serovar Khorat str. Khorat-H2]